MIKKKKKILIAGGGLAGLSAAYFLEQKNTSYLLVEKQKDFGGLCRTVKQGNYKFDFSGHLLHISNNKTHTLIKKLLKNNLAKHFRSSWIFSSNTFTPYPFQSHTYGLPIKIRKECLIGFIDAYISREKGNVLSSDANFEDWVKYYLGAGIGKYFMYPYNEKLWTLKPKELTHTWLNKYVPKPSIEDVVKGAFSLNLEKVGYNASFYYPKKGGINSLIDSFVRVSPTDNLLSNTTLSSINIRTKTAIINNKKIKYDELVSSLPLKKLILNILEDAPIRIKKCAKLLKANKVLNINLGVKRNIKDKHWIYFPENKYVFYRAGFANNFSKDLAPKGCSSIYTEIALKKNVKKSEYKNYINKVIKDLIKAEILSKTDIIDEVCPFLIDPAYVIYDKYRDECVKEILEFLEKNNIYSIGRYGRWEYSAMEDAMLQGYEVSRRIS